MTTTPTSGAAIQRYKIGYHADEWGQRSSTPSGIPDASGSWVRYADHVTALAAGQAVVPAGPWSLGYADGNWRDIDHQDHYGVMRIVWRMEGEERTPKCEALAHAVIAALNGAAAPAQPAAQQGAAYAATPTSNYAGRVYEEGFLIGTCPLYTADQLRAFADATYMLRASHGQAPATADSVLEDALSDAVRVPLDSLHADAAYLIGRLREGSMPYARVIEIIRERIDAAKAAIRARAAQGDAQEPCPTCAALARTVMLDQVSFDRKPDCYGIRQITDDDGVEEWEDIRTSPNVAQEEANDMMATGRGELYEVVALYTTPPVQAVREPLTEAQLIDIFKAADSEDKGRWAIVVSFARAIEAAHGIKGGQHGTDQTRA